VWHLPAFFCLETLEELSRFFLPGFIFGVLCGAVIFTWMYNGSGGSVLMVALWHGFLISSRPRKPGRISSGVMSALVIVWAPVITNLNRPWNFSM